MNLASAHSPAPCTLPDESESFLASCQWQHARRFPLPVTTNSLSARRYTRLRQTDGRVALLMDCADGSSRPFARIGQMLRQTGLAAPEIYAANHESGLLLIEDFGDDVFAKLLASCDDPWPVYQTAVDALIHLHKNFSTDEAHGLPCYDSSLFLDQVMTYTQVFDVSQDARATFREAWSESLSSVNTLPVSLMLRDYSAANLIRRAGKTGIDSCGILDFQDAGTGPVLYDLLSLVEGNRNPAPSHIIHKAKEYYSRAFPMMEAADFEKGWAVLVAQRRMRVLALFTNYLRKGRADLQSILPDIEIRFRKEAQHPALAPVACWYRKHGAKI